MYVEFTVSQTMEHFLACHQHAFECFGGVPQNVMVDNLKSAVLGRILGQEPMLNPKYAAYVTVKNMWRSIQNLRGQQRFDVLCAT
jgi:hypothetical protein